MFNFFGIINNMKGYLEIQLPSKDSQLITKRCCSNVYLLNGYLFALIRSLCQVSKCSDEDLRAKVIPQIEDIRMTRTEPGRFLINPNHTCFKKIAGFIIYNSGTVE